MIPDVIVLALLVNLVATDTYYVHPNNIFSIIKDKTQRLIPKDILKGGGLTLHPQQFANFHPNDPAVARAADDFRRNSSSIGSSVPMILRRFRRWWIA